VISVSISSFDVEKIDHRPLVRWVAGVIGAFTGILAIIGWPLPIVSGRYVQNDAWERTLSLINAWLNHAGWRMSGSSWFWSGISIAAVTGVILTINQRDLAWPKKWLVILIPGGLVGTLGPLFQMLLGVRWSNYASEDNSPVALVYLISMVVVIGLLLLRGWVMRIRDQPDDANATKR
jgi:hypothetical protein